MRSQAEFGPEGFQLIGVSLDTAHDRSVLVDSFRATYRVNYPMAFPDPMSQIAAGLEGIPTTLLFDRESRAAKVYVGELNEETFRADIATLLAEPLPPKDSLSSIRSER